MRLVNDDDRVVLEQKIRLDLLQQDAIGHELQLCALPGEELRIVPDLIAHLSPKLQI